MRLPPLSHPPDPRRSPRLLALLCLLGLAIPATADDSVGPAAIAPLPPLNAREPAAWLPLETGLEWSYNFVRERTRKTSSGEVESERVRGVRLDRVLGSAPGMAPDVVEITTTLQAKDQSGNPVQENQRSFYAPRGAHKQGVALVAREGSDPFLGKRTLERFEPELVLLDEKVGAQHPWKIGSAHYGSLETQLEGEILGLQDVETPAGLFERCLVLRSQGGLSGSVDLYGRTLEILEGRITQTEWFAPGVGRVLGRTEIQQTLRLPDGTQVGYSERSEYALRSAEYAASGAASGVN